MGDVIHGKHPPYKTSSNLIGNYSCFRNTEIQHLGKKWRKKEISCYFLYWNFYMKSCFVESEKKYPQIKFSSQNYYSLESNFFQLGWKSNYQIWQLFFHKIWKNLHFVLGAIHKWHRPLRGEGGSAKRWRYSISFSRKILKWSTP